MMFRREFLNRSAAGLVAAAIGSHAEYARSFTSSPQSKVRIALIGLRHSHAEGKLAALIELKDDFDLIGRGKLDLFDKTLGTFVYRNEVNPSRCESLL